MHKRTPRRLAGGLALIALLAAAAACGDDDDDAATPEETAATASTGAAESTAAPDTEAPASTEAPDTTETPDATDAAPGTTAAGASGEIDPDKPEIVIGNVSAITGPLATNLHQQLEALEAWAEWTNAQGGIDGHAVRVVSGDSKSDATAEAAMFQQLNESDSPVAFVGVGTFNLAGAQAYLEEQQIPVIGGQISDVIFENSPVMFSQGTSSQMLAYAMSSFAEGGKLGVVYCSESAGCTQSFENIKKAAPLAGAELVFDQKISLAEPDFTATCLAAKEAGVEYMSVSFNPPNYLRFAEQCATQDFNPTYIWSALLAVDDTAVHPNMVGAVAPQSNLPYFVTEEAGADFHAAMEEYAPDLVLDPPAMQGWASAELFKAAALIALENGEEVTSESLMAALRTMTDETLGGLAGPLAFDPDGGPNPMHPCYDTIAVEDGAWVQTNTEIVCVPEDIVAQLTS